MRVIFGAVALAAMLSACGPAAPTAEEIAKNSADLVAYLDAEYEEEVQQSPMEMTSQGRKDRYGELDDRTEAAMDARLAWRRESVTDMKAKFSPDALSEDARLSYEIWEMELGRAERSNEFRRHRYLLGRNGPHTGLINFIINQHRVDEKSDMEAYVSRVAALGTALDQTLERAKLAAADGIRMPGFAYDQTTSEIARVLTGVGAAVCCGLSLVAAAVPSAFSGGVLYIATASILAAADVIGPIVVRIVVSGSPLTG